VGRNPFVQSTMYGEGYDWTQQYTVSSGDIVGALPVGIQTRGNRDLPYWPSQNCYVYKEVWGHPVGRWFWLMQDLAGPALVEGRVKPGAARKVEFVETATGRSLSVEADAARGSFRAFIPEGKYTVRSGDARLTVTALPGGTHYLDLRPGHAVDFEMTAGESKGVVKIRLTAAGEGVHSFSIRTDNLSVDQPQKELRLKPGAPGTLVWKARVQSPGSPWVAVVIPDGDLSQRREVVSPAPESGS
jgi:hypothetical protein